jgi:surfeit locus 1 family protein
MSTRSTRFWVVTLATVFTMAVTAALGFWQLDRAGQKRALQERIEQRGQLAPWSTSELLEAPDVQAGLHRTVQLRGRWVQDATLFLDNRQMNARVGFFVITPLQLQGSDRAILIQRGWVARDFNDRSRVPVVVTPDGDVRLEGRLAPPPGRLFQLGEAGSGPIRQNVDIPGLAQAFDLSLLDISVLQTGNATDGMQREWPRVAAGVEKHHGYAFQWFGLCTLAGVLYVWFQFISPRRKRISHGPEAR